MESKRDRFCTRIELSKKLTIISVAIQIMAVFTQNLPKLFRKDCSRDSILKSFINQFKTIKETYFGQYKINENVYSSIRKSYKNK